MVETCGIHGDFINKSCRATSISRMIATKVSIDVIHIVTRHKNPNSLARYNRTATVRYLATQAASRGDPKSGLNLNYQDFFQQDMEHWRRKLAGGSIIALVGSHSEPLLGGTNLLSSFVLGSGQLDFDDCSEVLNVPSPAKSSCILIPVLDGSCVDVLLSKTLSSEIVVLGQVKESN